MDTEYDFLQPEFFNILFFQQKSLVVYPYVDINHLKALEDFAEGYTIINIDATALHNVSAIISHEAYKSYSIKPTLYLIVNATLPIMKDLMELPEIHCIVNISENVESLVKGEEFIFYNKKNKSFLNYDSKSQDLSYEIELLQESLNKQCFLQKLRDLHITATHIHDKLNETFSGREIIPLLEKYDPSVWEKILQVTKNYYKIEIPELPKLPHSGPKKKRLKQLKDFSHEYQRILKGNRKIGREFVQVLHNYRESKVNPANLELEQLFYPEKLYTYLRNHHWEKEIPQDFVDEWVLMKNTGHALTENDLFDFQILFQELGISYHKPIKDTSENHLLPDRQEKENIESRTHMRKVPSIIDFQVFKKWILQMVEELEKRLEI